MSKFYHEARYYFLIILFPLILLGWSWIEGYSFYWGTPALQFIPWRIFAWNEIQNGIIPLWNPWNGMGTPFVANYQSAIFYPPGWLLFLFGAVGGSIWIADGFMLLTILHLIWAGIGMARLMKSLGVGVTGQLVAAVAFELSGYIVARVGFSSVLWAVAWMPWIIFTASQVSSPLSNHVPGKRLVPIPLVICLSMMLLAGHAQVSWYILVYTSAWVFFGGYIRTGWKGGAAAFGRFLLSVILATLIAMVQLFPTAEYLVYSPRSTSVDYEIAMTYSFWPWRLITLFAPNFFGNPGTGNYWGYGSFWEDDIYIGLLPILLALSSLPIFFRRKEAGDPLAAFKKLVTFLWIMAVLGFILALGKNTFIFPFLYKNIVTFNMFHGPARFLIWTEFSFVVLAGLVVDHWRAPKGRSLYWFRLATAGGFAVTLGAFFTWLFLGNVSPTFVQATALAGIWALGCGLLTLYMPEKSRNTYIFWQTLVILWIGLDLLVADWYLNPITPSSFYQQKNLTSNYSTDPIQAHGRSYLSDEEEYRIKFKRFLRFKDYLPIEKMDNWLLVGLPDLNIITGRSKTGNFDPLVSSLYLRWMKAINSLPQHKQAAWLKLMGVDEIGKIDTNSQLGVKFYALPGGERFRWFQCAVVANDTDAWDLVKDEMVKDWGLQVPDLIIEGYDLRDSNPKCHVQNENHVEITVADEKSDKLTIKVSTDEDGWFFIADSWYPGWKAYIDGQATPIYRAYGTFRVVRLPAGDHILVYEYRPNSFTFGVILSILGIVCIIITWLWVKKHSPTSAN